MRNVKCKIQNYKFKSIDNPKVSVFKLNIYFSRYPIRQITTEAFQHFKRWKVFLPNFRAANTLPKAKKLAIFFIFLFCFANTTLSAQLSTYDTIQASQFLKKAQQQLDDFQLANANESIDAAIQILEQIVPAPTQLGYAYNIKGDVLYELGAFDEAIAYFLNAKSLLAKQFGVPHFEIAQSLNFLGLCHWRRGELEKATDFFQRGLRMRRELLGNTHPKVADSYNNLGNVALAQRDLTVALTSYQKALRIRRQNFGESHLDVASSFNNIGSCYRYAGQYATAIDYYNRSLAIRQKQLGEDHSKLGQNYLNLGDCYSQMEQLDTAIVYLNRALTIFQKQLAADDIQLADVYLNLGNCFLRFGQSTDALSFFEKAKKVQLAHYEADSPNLITVYNSLANVLDEQGDYQKALLYYENNLHILRQHPSFGLTHPFAAFTYNNLGLVETKLGNFSSALQHYTQAYNIYTAQQNDEKIAETFNNIGNCFWEQGSIQEALQNFQQSFSLVKKLGGDSNQQARILQNIGNCFFELNQLDLAEANYQKALILVIEKEGASSVQTASYRVNQAQILLKKGQYEAALQQLNIAQNLWSIPQKVEDFPDFIPNPTAWLRLLNAQGQTYFNLFEQSQKTTHLTAALSAFDAAISVVEQIRQQFQEVASKRQLGEKALESFAGAIAVCYELYQKTKEVNYVEQAFDYSEKSRSNLIVEALNTSQATSFSGIPDSLIVKEKRLKNNIAFYEKKQQLETQKGLGKKEERLDDYRSKGFQKKQEYEELIQHFRAAFPRYFALKYATPTTPTAVLQEVVVDPKTTLVEYFIADSMVYVFVLNQQTLSMRRVAVSAETLLKKIRDLRTSIYAYYVDVNQQSGKAYEQSLEKYASIGFDLYQILLQPIENQLKEKIVFVNGGILNYLPFDALLSEKVTNTVRLKRYPFLLKKYEISYAYSASLLLRLQQSESKAKRQKILAFAPEFKPNDARGLAPLAHNVAEVQGLDELVETTIFTKAQATQEQFLRLAPDYSLIHLSTHGQADAEQGDFSYLAFAEKIEEEAEDILYAKDIYNLSLAAEMVVLSACETGQGEALRSEGAVSLGRAFFYSGAKSIVQTLWSVDDASTQQLMHAFYEYLEEGATKSAALRRAKMALMDNGNYSHPYYWSAFMLVGDSTSLDLSSGWFGWGAISFALLAALFLFFLTRKWGTQLARTGN
ncbi:MAG: CHAT domain-containing tetratricopeptide repeat protein [Bacteroidota bacterium]